MEKEMEVEVKDAQETEPRSARGGPKLNLTGAPFTD
jgi:hypothetical protein